MLYISYDSDSGKIQQANKVYDWEADPSRGKKEYSELLHDYGHTFISEPGSNVPISPDIFMVNTTSMEKEERPLMYVEVSKTRIKCGPDDAAILSNIPVGAGFAITTMSGVMVYNDKMGAARELDISIPVPCVYHVVITLWPYRNFEVDIEAYAS